MDLTVSRPIKILALVGVLAAVAGAGAMTLLGRGQPQSSGASLPTVAQLRAQAHARAAAAAKAHPAKPAAAVAARPKTKAVAPAKAKPAAHKAAAPAKPAVTAPQPAADLPAVDANGLPLPLADELRAHRVVVVSIFDPQSQTDAISFAEARAGAGDAHVGFLGVSVLDDAVAGPLTAALPGGGLLADPGLLFYRAPGVLVLRIDGFADRDAVAQAAVAALTADPIVAPAATAPAVTTTVPDTVPLPTTTTGP